jgi:hypothetical protein
VYFGRVRFVGCPLTSEIEDLANVALGIGVTDEHPVLQLVAIAEEEVGFLYLTTLLRRGPFLISHSQTSLSSLHIVAALFLERGWARSRWMGFSTGRAVYADRLAFVYLLAFPLSRCLDQRGLRRRSRCTAALTNLLTRQRRSRICVETESSTSCFVV